MPELPDVEGSRRLLERHVAGRTISEVEVLDASVLRNISGAALRRVLLGRRFGEPDRKGKWLLAHTDGPIVLFHFGMTGSLVWEDDGGVPHRHDRVVFVTDAGRLSYRDQRKLRGIWVAKDDTAAARIIGHQGPDALGLSRRDLQRALRGRRGAIKPALMDQTVIAGLGNTLSDEILWRARLHPTRSADSLDGEELGRLHRALGTAVRASARAGRIPRRASWLTGERDEEHSVCPRCHHELQRSRIGGRASLWCPRCQPVKPSS